MMKCTRLACMAVALSLGASALADAANLLVSFSTAGADFYADGTTVVADGEWYALCWSPNPQFGGIAVDGSAAAPGDKVLLSAPLAKGGRCPFTVFEVDSADKPASDGYYFVFLLDTRDASGVPAGSKAALKAGGVNGAAVARDFTAAKSEVSTVASAAGAAADASSWAASAVDTAAEGFTQARISAIVPVENGVRITVSGMMPGVKYNVQMGAGLSDVASGAAVKSYALEVPKTSGDNDVGFTVSSESARFFKVVRQPLAGTAK